MKHNATIVRYNLHRMLPALLLIASLIVLIAGCGSSIDCSVAVSLDVFPQAATANHLAAPPGNQVSFLAGDVFPASCPPTPGPIGIPVQWSVSDPLNVTIGNTQGVDSGVATCKNATAGPITVTATGTNTRGATTTGTATLTCN